MGPAGQLPPSHGAGGGGANISFCPPRNIEGAPRKNCVEDARNSITPKMPLVETGQVRRIGAPRLPKGARPIQRPLQIGLPTPNWFASVKYTVGGNRASHKDRGPSAPKRGPADSRPSQNGLPPSRKCLTLPLISRQAIFKNLTVQ